MTTAAAVRFPPIDVIRAAAIVITARGYYQPLSRQWEEAVPTVMDVETLLYRRAHHERGDAARFARAAKQLPATLPAAVLEWSRSGTADQGDYRASLARAARTDHITERDIPLLCSAVSGWQREQRRAARAAQAATDAEHSRHQGTKGERITRTVTVAAVISQSPRTYGYRTQERRLVKLRDDTGAIYVWPAQPKSVTTLPQEGARIDITGTVTKHDTYRNTAQTYLGNCQWKPAA